MKKIFSVVLVIAVLAASNLTFAAYNRRGTLPQSEMYLGSVTIFNSFRTPNYWDKITEMYGKPNGSNGFTYGDSVKFSTAEGNLISILVTKNNGWKTPTGIGVGSSVNELMQKYGEPFMSKTYENKTVYAYCLNSDNPGVSDPFLHFLFDKTTKKIEKILLSGNTARMGDTETIFHDGFMELLGINYETYKKL